VARAAVEAGASSINDVRGGKEEGMLQTMSELDVPVFLMHSRGDSSSMTTSAMQDYGSLGVVEGVRREMVSMVQRALDAGVKRWNIVLDPGLGFAKSAQDSLVLLRHLEQLTAKGTELYGLPVLVGASRKGFVGKTIQRDVPKERGYGDAAVASWCAAKKVDVIRVHDVRAAGEVLAMHRAIAQAESGV
jgi:dihydroneopterin aldolase/2-amino-4-hydroxy-6-hydroxymethyldihydropteridine diphosphokinase/dihydropteroate synthase